MPHDITKKNSHWFCKPQQLQQPQHLTGNDDEYKGTIPEWVFVRFGLLPREEQHLLYRGLCSAEIPGR